MEKLDLPALFLVLAGPVAASQLTTGVPMAQTATTVSQQQEPSQPDLGAEQQEAKTFVGKIMQADGKYILKAGKATYQLDDQDKVKQFEGQKVKVIGTLDPESKSIHVSDIQAA